MTRLRDRRCAALPAGTPALVPERAAALRIELAPDWQVDAAGLALTRDFRFEHFHATMAFVNAVAWIAHVEDHHPDLEVGYGHCRVTFTTHSVGGLSENDFICAAKVDALQPGSGSASTD
jgi:4a-hydroxytetrahydrobiopterin dehydratase